MCYISHDPRFRKHFDQIILFGSQARGEATPDSDLDLLIVVRQASPSVTDLIRQIRYEVMEQHNFLPLLSLVILDERGSAELKSQGSGFLHNIEREGITLWPVGVDSSEALPQTAKLMAHG